MHASLLEQAFDLGPGLGHVGAAIDHHLVHHGTGLPQLFGQHLAAPAGPKQQETFPGSFGSQGFGQAFGPILLRMAIDAQPPFFQGPSGGRTDGRQLRSAQPAQVVAPLPKPPEEPLHAVGAGKDQPVVVGKPVQGAVYRGPVLRRLDADDRLEPHLGPVLFKQPGQLPGLLGRSGNQHPHSGKRRPLRQRPVPLQGGHLAHDCQHRRAQMFPGNQLGHFAQAAAQRLLIRPATAANQRHGRLGRQAVLYQLAAPLPGSGYPHVNHQRAGEPGQRGVIERLLGIIFLAAGQQRHGRSGSAIGERHPGVGSRPQGGRDSRHDFERDARLLQGFELLGHPGKQQRIASLESHDRFACPSRFNHPPVHFGLGEHASRAVLAQANPLRFGGNMVQQLGGGQIVVQDHLGLLQAAHSAQRNQPGVSRTGSHQVNFAQGRDVHGGRFQFQAGRVRITAKRGCRSRPAADNSPVQVWPTWGPLTSGSGEPRAARSPGRNRPGPSPLGTFSTGRPFA